MSGFRIDFGPFAFDPASGTLSRDGVAVAISYRAAALLRALLEAGGQPVTKAGLMDSAWPGTAVEEGNLTVQIAALRKTLAAAAGGGEWIVTVPRVGYRLVGRPAGDGGGLPARPSLAVLPFRKHGGEVDDYFVDGVVDDITTALSRFRSFAVLSRSASNMLDQTDPLHAATALGVRYLLGGSVRRSGSRVRISVNLFDSHGGANLWADQFEGALDDLFAFQDRITESVVALVEPQIQKAEIERSHRERPKSAAVYDIALRARALILSESVEHNAEADALLRQGLAQEPDNALLLAHAAWALEHRITMGWPRLGPDDAARCTDYARHGLERAGGDAVMMTHCGMALLQVAHEYDWAMAVLDEAVRINPNHLVVVTAAGVAHLHCGSIDGALTLLHRANRLGPGDTFGHIALSGIAHAEMVLGNYEEALTHAARSRALNAHFDASLWILTAANAHLGRMEAARHFLAELQVLAPGLTIAAIRAGQPRMDPSRLAAILEGLRLAGLAES